MTVFDVISLFGGLAMFLYGMRLMGDGLQEGSTGTLKKAMESVTNSSLKAFLLGLLVTGVIQSSTATIVITSGLVGAGIIRLSQSLGIIVGANVGTTVTGQIIRLLDVDASANSILKFFQPSTLAPLALIFGILCLMFLKFRNSRTVGSIAIGFGILFSGLLSMTSSVNVLTESGVFDRFFESLSGNPFIGYLTGFAIAFILQSSSASIGILQAFSMSGVLTFRSVYAVILGIYLGDCITTAMVCAIGAKADPKRVGIINVFYNLGKTLVVIVLVTLLRGTLTDVWNEPVHSGNIANMNTVFNLIGAVILLPFVRYFETLSRKIVKDDPQKENPYADLLEQLNPVFFSSPAIAFRSCYNVLCRMFDLSRENIMLSFELLKSYDPKKEERILETEEYIDMMADRVSKYMLDFSSHLKSADLVQIMDQYYKVVTEFERLGDHATNIAEIAGHMYRNDTVFSPEALQELEVLRKLISRILDRTETAFKKRNLEAARHIEPLEEVVDDMVNALRDNHLERLKEGKCSVIAGTDFLNLLSDIERISDVCSNVGVATVARIEPEKADQAHGYISSLHQGDDELFNKEYHDAHDEFFSMLEI